MNQQPVSGKAVKVFVLTLICFVIMLGVSLVNKNRIESRLSREYTVSEGDTSHHVLFEKMPVGEAQTTVALFMVAQGLGNFRDCEAFVPQNKIESMNFQQQYNDYQDGRYIKEYVIHSFQTLPRSEYADRRDTYSSEATLLGYKEFQVIRLTFSQKWSEKALEQAPQWGDGQYTRDFVVGRTGRKWKIFDMGAMQ